MLRANATYTKNPTNLNPQSSANITSINYGFKYAFIHILTTHSDKTKDHLDIVLSNYANLNPIRNNPRLLLVALYNISMFSVLLDSTDFNSDIDYTMCRNIATELKLKINSLLTIYDLSE